MGVHLNRGTMNCASNTNMHLLSLKKRGWVGVPLRSKNVPMVGEVIGIFVGNRSFFFPDLAISGLYASGRL